MVNGTNVFTLTLFLITGSTDQTYCMNGGPKIAEKLVKTWCNAKRRCYLEANRRLFGGPCDHHRQALRVAYECVMANLCKFLNVKGPQISQPSQYSFWKSSHTLNDWVEVGFVLFWLVLFCFDFHLVSFRMFSQNWFNYSYLVPFTHCRKLSRFYFFSRMSVLALDSVRLFDMSA